jgi:uncharacterized protein (TIGR02271 family)
MTTTNRSFVTGIFADEQHAQQAMSDLQEAGFSNKQIQYSPHKSGASILDSLTDMGFGQDEATYYNNEYQQGRTIVTVKDEARQQQAATILQRNGASLGSRRADQNSETPSADYATEDAQRLRLREERLQATTTPTQVGEVGLRKEVVNEQQSIDVPVSHEEVYIERRASDGQVSDTPIGEGETLRVPVSAEQVNVSKQTVQSGEVSIGKRAVQGTQQVTDTVRHEEARVERQGDVTVEGDNTGIQEM